MLSCTGAWRRVGNLRANHVFGVSVSITYNLFVIFFLFLIFFCFVFFFGLAQNSLHRCCILRSGSIRGTLGFFHVSSRLIQTCSLDEADICSCYWESVVLILNSHYKEVDHLPLCLEPDWTTPAWHTMLLPFQPSTINTGRLIDVRSNPTRVVSTLLQRTISFISFYLLFSSSSYMRGGR